MVAKKIVRPNLPLRDEFPAFVSRADHLPAPDSTAG